MAHHTVVGTDAPPGDVPGAEHELNGLHPLKDTALLEGDDQLLDEVRKPTDDPLGLDAYLTALDTITTSRGKAMRRLVYDTFLRFFNGATPRLDWEDTARQITG